MVENKEIIAIVKILRKVTVLVKLYPFLYSVLYIVCMLVYMFGTDSMATTCDQLFYVSPFSIVCAVLLSYSLKLCKWHRLECVLPLLPTVVVFIDEFVCTFGKCAAYLNSILVATIAVASLINAYFVFVKPKQ
jgi:hypothetical protein